MQLKTVVTAVIGAIAVVGVGAGIYSMSSKNSGEPTQMAGVAGKLPEGAQMPANHPPIDQVAPQGAAAGQPISPKEFPKAGTAVPDPKAKFTHFKVGNSNVKSIYVDGTVAWVGTSGAVVRYDTKDDTYHLYDNRDGLLSKSIFYIGKLDDRIVAGTYGGGMSLLDKAGQKWDNINVPNGLADAFVYKVLKADNGDVWIATWSGANRIRGGNLNDPSKWDTFTVENTKGGLPNDWVYGLDKGKDGTIWLATEGGLARFKDGKWQNWSHDSGVGAAFEKVKNDPQFGNDPAKVSSHHAKQKEEMGLKGMSVAYNPNYIISMLVDPNGVVWCGTWGGGLARFDGKKWTNYTMADGLPGNHVFMLHQNKAGLWIGTNNGLARFDGSKFKVFTTEHGLYSNTVFSMATAPDGSYWIGSFGGVTHIKELN